MRIPPVAILDRPVVIKDDIPKRWALVCCYHKLVSLRVESPIEDGNIHHVLIHRLGHQSIPNTPPAYSSSSRTWGIVSWFCRSFQMLTARSTFWSQASLCLSALASS